jgi:DNA-binding response OmpR family regulator
MATSDSVNRVRPLILVVEAERMLRRTISKFLERYGYQVTACADAADAGGALTHAANRPSLIVLGARALDGDTANAAWRLRGLAPGVPMLGIADVLYDDVGQEPSLPDNLRFLAPPFDMPDVLRAVRSLLQQAGFDAPLELEA